MTGRRYVRQSGDGSWEVLREGDRRARVRADTESEALRRAKEIVTREGGGEVRVVNRAGKVVSVDKVARAGQPAEPGEARLDITAHWAVEPGRRLPYERRRGRDFHVERSARGEMKVRRHHLHERRERVRLPRLDDVDDAVLGVLEGYEIACLYRRRQVRDPKIVTFE